MQLTEVAAQLYGVPPEEFVAARDTAIRAAKADGDADLAADIKTLRRPPVSVWVVNTLVRSDAAALDDLLALGESLRAAQDALDGAELRTLSRDRHRIVRALVDQACTIAGLGDPSPAVKQDVEATLDAALTDERAAAAVMTGRLMRPLQSSGLEDVELTGAILAEDQLHPAERARRTTRTAAKKAKPAAKKAPARRANTRAAVTAARAEARGTERELARSEKARAAAEERLTGLQAEIGDLEKALAKQRKAARDAETKLRHADDDLRGAGTENDAAQRTLARAESRLSRQQKR